MAKMPAPFRDDGNAQFGSSAGARNAIAYANPLSPGGLNPKNASIPTIVWAVAFVVVGYIVYKNVLKK
jgi:hypothetical protein